MAHGTEGLSESRSEAGSDRLSTAHTVHVPPVSSHLLPEIKVKYLANLMQNIHKVII